MIYIEYVENRKTVAGLNYTKFLDRRIAEIMVQIDERKTTHSGHGGRQLTGSNSCRCHDHIGRIRLQTVALITTFYQFGPVRSLFFIPILEKSLAGRKF